MNQAVNLEVEWKKSIKMCQLTQYMLNFPKLIGEGEMKVKIIFDPSKYPQYSMFKKVPSNFEFRIEFDITNAGSRKVINYNKTVFTQFFMTICYALTFFITNKVNQGQPMNF